MTYLFNIYISSSIYSMPGSGPGTLQITYLSNLCGIKDMERWRKISGMTVSYSIYNTFIRTEYFWLFSVHWWQIFVVSLEHAFRGVLRWHKQSVFYSRFLFACRIEKRLLKTRNRRPSWTFSSLFLPHHFLPFYLLLSVPLHVYMLSLICSSNLLLSVISC